MQIGDKVIVNTGGEDSPAYIDFDHNLPFKRVVGDHVSYLCRFTENSNRTYYHGNDRLFVEQFAQYIPEDKIKLV